MRLVGGIKKIEVGLTPSVMILAKEEDSENYLFLYKKTGNDTNNYKKKIKLIVKRLKTS